MVELDGHHYALIVDAVEDVVEALSDPRRCAPRWARAGSASALGMVETEEGPLLLVDIDALIAGPASDRAAA